MADNLQRVGIELVAEDGGFLKNARAAKKIAEELTQTLKDAALEGTKFEGALGSLGSDTKGIATDLRKASTSVKDLASATSKGTQAASKYTNKQKDLKESIKLTEALIEGMKIEFNQLNSELAKDATGKAANRQKVLAASIAKAEVELDNLKDSLARNTVEYGRMTGMIEQLTAAERAELRYTELKGKAINRDIVLRDKYDALLKQQTLNTERLVDAIKEEEIHILRLSRETQQNSDAIEERTVNLQRLKVALKASEAQEKSYASSLDKVSNSTIITLQRQKEAFRAVEEQGQGIRDIGFTIQDAGLALTAFTTVPIAAGLAASTKAAIEFESSFTGILKTVDGAVRVGTLSELTAQGEELRQAMLDLALVIPATTTELNLVGERAGQLGVAAEDIAEFTRVVVEFGEATDVTSEDASKAFAQVFNVFKNNLDEQDIVKFSDAASNAIVHLGNNFATTESEILHFFQTFAGGAAAFDVTAQDALAIATAFKSVRAQTASSSTGIQKTFLNMANAVQSGNKNLHEFAKLSGLTAEEFAAQWESRPAVAFQKFLAGLGAAGDKAPNILRDLGLGDVRIQREFLKAAGGADVLAEALELSADAFGNFGAQGARAEEAARRFATTESQLKLLSNELTNLAISIGETLLPTIRRMVTEFRPAIEAIAEFIKQHPGLTKTAATIAAVTAAIGPLITVGGRFIATIGGFKAGIGSLNLGVAALKLAGHEADDALTATVANATTLKGVFQSLSSALGVSVKSLAAATLGIGAIVGIATVAVIKLYTEIKQSNKRVSEMVTSTADAVDSIGQLSDKQLDLLNTIVRSSNSFEDYTEAITVAGFATGELTEAQYNLIKSQGLSANEIDKTTAAIQVYAEEVQGAATYVKLFSSFEGPAQDVIQQISNGADGVEDYTAKLLEFQKVSSEANPYADPFNTDAISGDIFEDLTSQTEDASEVVAALTEIFGDERGALIAVGNALGDNIGVQAEYRRNGKDLVAIVEEAINANEEYKLGLGAAVRAVQEFTGALSPAELEIVALGNELGESNEQMVRSIKMHRLMQRAASETANQYAALTVGVEGINSFSDALQKAGEIAGDVEQIFQEGSDAAISSIGALAAAWEDFETIIANTEDGNLAENFIEITEATQDLKDSFAEAAIEAERARLESLEYSQVEIDEQLTKYSNALGLLSDKQAAATIELIHMREETQLLVTAFSDGYLSVEQQAAALELLAGGYVVTAEDAYHLVQADERIVTAALDASRAVREQGAALEVASAEALEAAQAFIATAKAQDSIVESGRTGIRKLFEQTSTGASSAAASVEQSVDKMAKSYVGFIDEVKDGEQPIESWGKLLLDNASAAGASLEQIVALTIATGELSDEQAQALFNQVAAMKAVEGIADAYVKGQISADEAASAVKGMQAQIEAGERIDLSQYGVYVDAMNDVQQSSSSAGSAVQDAKEVLKQSVIEMVSSFDELSSAEIRELEVQFGLISVDQADSENKYEAALEAMRLAFGQTFVDGVPVEFGLDVLGIDNFQQYYEEIYTLAQQGADVAEAIELVVGVSTSLGLEEVDSQAFYDEVMNKLTQDPSATALDVVASVVVEQDLDTEALGGDLATLAAQGLEITATYQDEGLQEYLTDILDKTETVAGEEVVHNAIFQSNIFDEGGVGPEVEELQTLINNVVNEGNAWIVPMNSDDIFNAKQYASELLGSLDVIDGYEATVKIHIDVTGDEIPDSLPGSSSGSTGGGAANNYHGGLLRGKIGRDKFLSWVSHGEYIMPNYITRQPGVLAALEKIKSSGGAWTPTLAQQRLSANIGNGVTTHNVNSDNSVSNKKNVTININGGRGNNTRSKMLAFTNLNRV